MIKVGSDFSGVGAFDQALIRLGTEHETVFACDLDAYARQTYIANYGEPKYFPKDVYEREIPEESLDIYMTSPPCQAFSLAGKRKGEEDKRGILFYNSHEFIIKNRPRFFIFENVKGLLSDDGGKTFQRWVDYLAKSINGNPMLFPHEESAGYHVYYKVLNSKDFGVPQNRERIFIIGIRDDKDNHFRFPKEIPLKIKLKDVLEDEVDDKYYLSEKAINKCIKSTANSNMLKKDIDEISRTLIAGYYKIPFDGQYINSSAGPKRLYGIFDKDEKRHQAGSVYDKDGISPALDTGQGGWRQPCIETKGAALRTWPRDKKDNEERSKRLEVREDDLANSITTHQTDSIVKYNYGSKSLNKTLEQNDLKEDDIKALDLYNFKAQDMCPTLKEPHHNDLRLYNKSKVRKLTPRECFRLQDFPDTFKMPCSDTQMYKQAGNSITVSVIYHILKKILKG